MPAAQRANRRIQAERAAEDASPSDAQILDFLDRHGVDAIYLRNGGCIDVRNSGGNVRGAIAEAMDAEREKRVPAEAAAVGAGLDPDSIEQGEPA
ncbi:hypothetical protein C8245_23040 [Paracidovorax avenae]|nr:hypothetical protein C8245_23040 [Paracidovorax avenae]